MRSPFGYVKSLAHKIYYRFVPSKVFLNKKFKKFFGKNVNWKNPTTYNEKLQWLKVYNKNPLYTKLVDKYEVRDYVAKSIGEKYLVPLLTVCNNVDELDFDKLPNKFVLKCTHDSGSVTVCKDKNTFDIVKAKERLKKRLKTNFYYNQREWPYKHVKPRIIAEKYMQTKSGTPPLDYKFMCFNGEPMFLFLDIGVCESSNLGGHAEHYYRNIYDMEFSPVDMKETREHIDIDKIKKPKAFEEMKQIVTILCKDIPHCRIDLYDIDDEIYFGEITFFHGAGYNFFEPKEWDEILGSYIKLPK